MRDILFFEKSTYSEFQASPEGISTNILAARLSRLEGEGLITKTPYQSTPVRYAYAATAKGESLRPVLRKIAAWGLKNIPGTAIPNSSSKA